MSEITTWREELGISFAAAGRALCEGLRAAGWMPADAPPPHPMLAAIEARRTRNTGPAAQPLDPRRRGRR